MTRRNRGATLALACGVYAGAGLSLSAVGPSIMALAANVEQTAATVGAQFTAFSLGTIIVQLAAAPVGERFGQRLVLGMGALMLGLGVLGESLSREFGWLLGFAVLGGLGFGCVLAAGVLLIARLFAARSASALNLVNLFFGVGSIIGPLVAGYAGAAFGRPELAMMLGATLLILLAPLLPWVAEAKGELSQAEASTKVPWALVLLLGGLLLVYSGTEIAVGGWATFYLEASAAMTVPQAALAVSAFWLAFTAGRGLGALLGLRVATQTLLVSFLSLLVVAAALLAISVGNALWSVLALMLFGLACGPIFPTTMALVAAVSGGRGVAASVALAVGNLGAGSIPPLLGVVLSSAGPPAGAALILGAVVSQLLLFAAVTLLYRRRRLLAVV